MMEEGDAMMEEGDAMMEEGDSSMTEKDSMLMEQGVSFQGSGQILAGSTTPLVDFSSEDYQKALAEGRTIFLYFYANWCPICTAELPHMYAGFNAVDLPQVVGFRVNYNDNETDESEEALARQFGIAYQHTKVIVIDGQQFLKDGSTWETDRYIEVLQNATR
jgi:thiol-disulfide isomerase/thioredoxin